MSDLVEFRLGHPGVLASTELAQIVRVNNRAIATKGRLIACATPGWSIPASQDPTALALYSQVAASTRDFAPLYRGFVSIPVKATRLRIVSGILFPVSDFVLAYPRASATYGADVDVVSTRAIPASDLTVSGSYTATFTLDEGHGLRPPHLLWTQDFSDNVPESTPAVVIGRTATSVVAALSGGGMSDGSKGAGNIRAPADYLIDTASNDEEGRVVGPIAKSYWQTFVANNRLPTWIEQTIDLAEIDTASNSILAEVLVELRCRTATAVVDGVAPIGELPAQYRPICTLIYADVDEDDLSPSPLELSAGDEITAELLTAINTGAQTASLKEITHAAFHSGATAWDDYSGATGDGGLVRDLDATTTTTILDLDIYLDGDTPIDIGLLHTVGSGSWTATVAIDGVTAVTSGTLSTASANELVLSTGTISAGWRRVQLTLTGSGAIQHRGFRITESTYIAVPAND